MEGDTCPLTGASCFGEALATIIASPENALAARVVEVEIVRTLTVATIEYIDKKEKPRVSKFGTQPEELPLHSIKATLGGGALVEIAILLEAAGETDAE